MIKKGFAFKKGFTLVELIITMAITAIVIVISANLLLLGIKSHKVTISEYDLQSSVRRVTEEATKIVRYSKAVFAVPQTFIKNSSNMDPGWNYFMVSSDKKRIVTMDYDGSKFVEKVLVAEQGNIEYEVVFEKDTTSKKDSVMKYKIIAYAIDSSGKRTNEKIVFESTVESTNAIQVVDKGTKASPSIALAYRNDGQTSGKGKNQIAYITIVTDTSGSMNEYPDGTGGNTNEKPSGDFNSTIPNSKIKHVRKALTDTTNGIIQKFSTQENLFISFVPFSTTGNYPDPTLNTKPNERHSIYEVNNTAIKSNLVKSIEDTKALGGTNTGDGLRQAYNLHNDFRTRMPLKVKAEDQVHHYMILLVDGKTTYETSFGDWIESFYWSVFGYRWELDSSKAKPKYYLYPGNIDSESFGLHRTKPGIKYGITGDGNTTITGTSTYVDAVGGLIKSFETGNGIKSYIIGYGKGLTTHVKSIGKSIGTNMGENSEPNNVYNYDDTSFNLDEVFDNIAKDIIADFWLVSGPKIVK